MSSQKHRKIQHRRFQHSKFEHATFRTFCKTASDVHVFLCHKVWQRSRQFFSTSFNLLMTVVKSSNPLSWKCFSWPSSLLHRGQYELSSNHLVRHGPQPRRRWQHLETVSACAVLKQIQHLNTSFTLLTKISFTSVICTSLSSFSAISSKSASSISLNLRFFLPGKELLRWVFLFFFS